MYLGMLEMLLNKANIIRQWTKS